MPWKGPVPKIPCPKCGSPMYRRGTMCRQCYRSQVPKSVCPKCGGPMPQKYAERCWACYMKERTENRSQPTCIECGTLISWQVGTGKNKSRPSRCWDCEVKRRHDLRVSPRTIGDNRSRHKPAWMKRILHETPCMRCGWDRAARDKHRPDPTKGYIQGNVVVLCPNCHREAHAGLITLTELYDLMSRTPI